MNNILSYSLPTQFEDDNNVATCTVNTASSNQASKPLLKSHVIGTGAEESELTAAKVFKWFFISRVSSGADASCVTKYIENKLSIQEPSVINLTSWNKMNTNVHYTSFKIDVPEEFALGFMEPTRILIKEFQHKKLTYRRHKNSKQNNISGPIDLISSHNYNNQYINNASNSFLGSVHKQVNSV